MYPQALTESMDDGYIDDVAGALIESLAACVYAAGKGCVTLREASFLIALLHLLFILLFWSSVSVSDIV